MPGQPRPIVPATLTPMIDSWELALDGSGKSPRTIEMYLDIARWFAGWLGQQHPGVDDWADVDRTHLRGFFAAQRDAGYSKSYLNNMGRCLQQWWTWYALEEDAPNPMDKVVIPAAPKVGETPPPVIAVDQLAALIKHAEAGKDFESRRDAALLRLFASTGCRLAEVAGLDVDDVNAKMREAQVIGKGSKRRTVRFDAKSALALDRYLRVRARHKAVTEAGVTALWIGVRRRVGMTPSGIRQVIERRGAQLGLDLHPHLFRHTFAHRWLDGGGAEGDLMALAGWESAQMLRHYGASARSARARRSYDRVDVMGGV